MTEQKTTRRLLVLGAGGMLGHAVLRWFASDPAYEVFGTLRGEVAAAKLRSVAPRAQIIGGFAAERADDLARMFDIARPEVVINCVGVVKQLAGAGDPAIAIPINALLPHRLARLCGRSGARLIHVGTDCVFSGAQGGYSESDVPDARDLYGRSKLMGEVDYPHAITLRTSIIGHELGSGHGLVGWFLTHQEPVRGFARAVFSALPTYELARVIQQYVMPNAALRGIYHVGGDTINKYELLKLVAEVYGRAGVIARDDELVIDRSLDSSRFRAATGYRAPAWPELVQRMREFA
jgi:dTDP-4-dehydrorhamnose reductase